MGTHSPHVRPYFSRTLQQNAFCNPLSYIMALLFQTHSSERVQVVYVNTRVPVHKNRALGPGGGVPAGRPAPSYSPGHLSHNPGLSKFETPRSLPPTLPPPLLQSLCLPAVSPASD